MARIPEGFENVADVFSNGYCHALALVLHATQRWGIVGLVSRDGYTDHYMVRSHNGALIDVTGVYSDSDVIGWGYSLSEGHTARDIWAEVDRGNLEDPGDVWNLAVETAARIARQQAA